jgi:hypothetical protein
LRLQDKTTPDATVAHALASPNTISSQAALKDAMKGKLASEIHDVFLTGSGTESTCSLQITQARQKKRKK